MKRAFLDDARPSDVSHAVRDVLERRGALVSEHVSSRVRFHGLSGPREWSRSGYIGIYQRLGESEVEVRLLLRAKWPWRLLVAVAAVNVLVALFAFATDPPVATWIFAAFACGLALVVSGLLYVNTIRPTREAERLLMEDFEAEFRASLPGARLEDWDERALKEAELALEGEVTARRVEKARRLEPSEPRSAKKGFRFNLLPGRKGAPPAPQPDADSVEERRARLLARKAEIEAKRRREG